MNFLILRKKKYFILGRLDYPYPHPEKTFHFLGGGWGMKENSLKPPKDINKAFLEVQPIGTSNFRDA